MKRANPAPGYARNPDKQISIEPFSGTVRVIAGDGVVVAETEKALLLREPPYDPAYYIPFRDIRFERMVRTERTSHCPFKGNASYWSIPAAGESGDNAMWAYEEPYDEALPIKAHGAFYPNKVRIETR